MEGYAYGTQVLWVVLDCWRVQDFPVVFANLEIFVIVVGQSNLLFEVTKLEICDVVIHFHGCLIRPTGLLSLLRLLLELLDLLGGLLRLAVEVPLVDLPAENLSLGPVSALNAQRDLLQDEFCLFPSSH
jgi:hypothetical protein